MLEWHVAEGDFVNEGDTVVEVSTDKVDAEVPAPTDGVITKLLASVDDEVPVGAPLAEMEPGEDGIPPRVRTPGCGSCRGGGGACGRRLRRRLGPSDPRHPQEEPPEPPGGTEVNGAEDVRATPVARRVAEELGVDLGVGRRVAGRGRRSPRRMCSLRRTVAGTGPAAAPRRRRRGEAAAGAGGDAGQGDGREPRGADRDLVPDDRGRHARRQAQGAQRGPQRARDEGLLHPPRRLGDRPGGQGAGR